VAPWVARFPRLWLYRRVAVARGRARLLAALIAPLVDGRPEVLLGVFLICMALCLGCRVAAVPFVEVVSKTVPASGSAPTGRSGSSG
jgi:hypothetical protein